MLDRLQLIWMYLSNVWKIGEKKLLVLLIDKIQNYKEVELLTAREMLLNIMLYQEFKHCKTPSLMSPNSQKRE